VVASSRNPVNAPRRPPNSRGGHPTLARAAEIRGAVVAATMAAFGHYGTGFTMNQVAALASASKQASYRRWRSKSDLLVEAIDIMLDTSLDADPDTLPEDPFDALRELAWRWLSHDTAIFHGILTYLQTEALSNDTVRARIAKWHHRFIATNALYIGRMDPARLRTPDRVEEHARILLNLMMGARLELAINGRFDDASKAEAFSVRWDAFTAIVLRPATGQ
jgi:AcrR family transcriptional regulator